MVKEIIREHIEELEECGEAARPSLESHSPGG